MIKILALQFRKSPESKAGEQNSLRQKLGATTTVDFVDVLEAEVDWGCPETVASGYHGVILGGSGDLDFDGGRAADDEARLASYTLLEKLTPFLQYIFDRDMPTLGICYGHQMLGAFAGGRVFCDANQRKTCSHEVKLLADKCDSVLFSDMPETFYAHYGHKDSLDDVPEGAVLLLNGGEKCKVPALRYKQNIYTFQFHPELDYREFKNRVAGTKGYLPEGMSVDDIVINDDSSGLIIRNFGRLVKGLGTDSKILVE